MNRNLKMIHSISIEFVQNAITIAYEQANYDQQRRKRKRALALNISSPWKFKHQILQPNLMVKMGKNSNYSKLDVHARAHSEKTRLLTLVVEKSFGQT